jgi:anti-sigma factor RsiW
MKNFRDIEQLSAYLDGQLSPSDSARLESRITADPELASVLSDLRAARGILRKLPARKAPRNFTLTRQMVGLKPPLPRTFSFFRFSTAFAAFLLMLTFAANSVLPSLSSGAAAPMAAQEAYGIGGGCEEPCSPSAVTVATEAPVVGLAPLSTESLPSASEDTERVAETPVAKEAPNASAPQDQPTVKNEALISTTWQIGLLVIGLMSAGIAFAINQNAKRKWG